MYEEQKERNKLEIPKKKEQLAPIWLNQEPTRSTYKPFTPAINYNEEPAIP